MCEIIDTFKQLSFRENNINIIDGTSVEYKLYCFIFFNIKNNESIRNLVNECFNNGDSIKSFSYS